MHHFDAWLTVVCGSIIWGALWSLLKLSKVTSLLTLAADAASVAKRSWRRKK